MDFCHSFSTTYTGYEDREEDDMPVEVAVVQASAKPQEKEPLSAKELALQAMGSHATKIKDIMRTNGATDDSNTNSGMKARTRSQDDLLRPLSLIVEEGDGEENPRVRFEGDKVGSAKPVPRVVVTKVGKSNNIVLAESVLWINLCLSEYVCMYVKFAIKVIKRTKRS